MPSNGLAVIGATEPQFPLLDFMLWFIRLIDTDLLSELWLWGTSAAFLFGLFFAVRRLYGNAQDRKGVLAHCDTADKLRDYLLRESPPHTLRSGIGRGTLLVFIQGGVAQWDQAHGDISDRSPAAPIDIAALLAWSHLEDRVTNQRLLRLLPGILVGLGILGTFVGLTVAINGLDFSSANSIDIPGMLKGMTLAFTSSIAGIFGSLAFQATAAFLLRREEKAHLSLCEKLGKLFPFLAPEALDSALLAEQVEQGQLLATTLESIRASLGDQLADSGRHLLLAQVMEATQRQRQHEQMLTHMNEHAAMLRQELSREVEQLATDNAAASRTLARQIDESLATRVESSFSKFLSVFQEQQQEGWQALTSTIRDQVHDLTAKEFAALREVLNEIIQLHDREADARERGISSLERATKSGEDMLLALEDSSRHLQEYAGALKALQESLRAEVAEQGAAQEAQLQLLGELQSSLNSFREAQIETATELRRSLQDTLSAAVSFISRTIEQQQEDLESALSQFAAREEALERSFEAASGRLEAAVETAAQGIVAGGASMAAEMRSAIQEELLSTMKQVMDSLDEGRETLARHLDEIRDQTENLTDSLEAIMQEIRRKQVDATKVSQDLLSAIGQSESTLKSMTKTISNASAGLAEQTNGQLDKFRTEVDNLLSTAVSHLGGTIGEMQDATEPLPATMAAFQAEMKTLVVELVRLRGSISEPAATELQK